MIVTGGAGFVGKRVCVALRMGGIDPYVIDPAYNRNMDCPGVARLAEDVISNPGADIHAVVHLASPVGTYGVVEQAGVVASRILSAAQAALGLAMTHDCPLVNVSTSEVYGIQQDQDLPVYEGDRPRYPPRWSPRLAYATGKLAAENDLHTSDHRDRIVTVRPFNIAGPGQDARLGFVIPRFVDQALSGERLTIFGDGSLKRGFMHVDDLARLIVMLVANRSADGRLMNAAGPFSNVITIRDLAARVLECAGLANEPDRIEHVDGKAVFGQDWEEAAAGSKIGDASLAEKLVGWRASLSLDAIIDDVLDEHSRKRGTVRVDA